MKLDLHIERLLSNGIGLERSGHRKLQPAVELARLPRCAVAARTRHASTREEAVPQGTAGDIRSRLLFILFTTGTKSPAQSSAL
jgi:hypothetical protein